MQGDLESYFEKKSSKMDDTKLNPADLNFSCQELSNGGLGFVVALSVCWQINVSCVYTGGPIQL